jgi:hypothetical protein
MLECCKEVCPDGIEEPHIVLECDIDVSEKLSHEPSSLLQLRAIQQSRRRVAVDKHLSSQRPPDRAALKAKQWQKIKQGPKVLLPAWREKMRAEVGIKCSRKQLLEALLPKAGERGKAQSLSKEAEALVAQQNGSKVHSWGLRWLSLDSCFSVVFFMISL